MFETLLPSQMFHTDLPTSEEINATVPTSEEINAPVLAVVDELTHENCPEPCVHRNNPIDTRGRVTRVFQARYPGIAKTHPEMIRQFVDYELARIANHGLAPLEPPVMPERLSNRHPFAN
jgi:hypothetical protein